MKHIPATPLPWEVDDEAQICANGGVVATTTEGYPAFQDKDAAYIAHAANAYPRLVEYVRAMVRQTPVNEDSCPRDLYAAKEGRALLAELGE